MVGFRWNTSTEAGSATANTGASEACAKFRHFANNLSVHIKYRGWKCVGEESTTDTIGQLPG